MKKSFGTTLMVLALSVAAMAAPKVKKQDLKLIFDSDIAGTQLKPGDYQVSVDGGRATIYHNGKSVVSFAVRSEEVAQKFQRNTLVYDADTHSLQELRLAGSATKLHVEGSAPGVAGAASGKN